jgi:hypothetical protein
MDLMLTIETVEWNGFICQHWTPQEDKAILASLPARWENRSQTDKDIFHALWNPTGLSLGDAGHMQLFVCRSCASFPIVPKIECS